MAAALDRASDLAQTLERGFAQHRAGDLAGARDAAQTAIRRSPRLAGGYYLLGLVECDAGQFGRAIRALTEAKRLGPPAAVVDLALARAQSGAGKTAAAAVAYRNALALDPSLVPALTGLALLRIAEDDLLEAGSLLERAASAAPDRPDVWNNLGSVARSLGRLDLAVAAFERATLLRPDYVRALANLGATRMEAGDATGALDALRRAVALDPANRTAANNLAHALKAAGEIAAAVEIFQRLADDSPGDGEAWIALGLAGQAAGDEAAARSALTRATELLPNDPRPRFCLGELARQGGDLGAAQTEYRAALALDPADRCGAGLGLALIGAAAAPSAPPTAYVAELFDGYAARFDRELTGALGYRAPEALRALLDKVAGADARFPTALDLGCGTGLMAAALADRADVIDGVDLSPRMIALARAGGRYRRLIVGDVVEQMTALDAGVYDLAVAADVLVYLGDLAPAFLGARRVLRSGGLLTFTVEAIEGDGWTLRDTHRYAHASGYVEATLVAAGFTVRALESVSTRLDRGAPVPGLAVVAQT